MDLDKAQQSTAPARPPLPADARAGVYRPAVPFLVFLLGVLISLVVWRVLHDYRRTHIAQNTHLEAESIRNEILSRIEFRVEGLNEIAESLRGQSGLISSAFREEAGMLSGPFSGFRAIEVLDAEGEVREVVSSHGEGPVHLDIRDHDGLERAWQIARSSRRASARFVNLGGDDGRTFVVLVPIFEKDRFLGNVVGIFAAQELFRLILPTGFAPNYSFALYEGDREIYRRDSNDGDLERDHAVDLGFSLYRASWRVRVWPTYRQLSYVSSLLPEWIFFLGATLSALLAYSLHLLRLTNLRAEALRREVEVRERAERELKSMNDNLESLVDERTEAVNRYAQELARSNAELEQFAFIASHDLKEPLRMVSSYVRLIQRGYKGKLDTQADEFIDFAIKGARRMNELIDALLRYSRVGRGEPPLTEVDTGELVETVLRTLQPDISERGTRVHLGKLPVVQGDPTQLLQLLQNLVGNALKFSDGKEPQIWIGAEPSENGWHFYVRDNGIGIDPKDADRIFVIFQRLHRDSRFPGTGIGLAVCKKIVERHQGRIWVESEPGRGATFHFTLPLRPATPSASA